MADYLRKLKITLVTSAYKNPFKGQVHEPKQLYKVFKDLKDEAKETLLAVYLNDKVEINSFEIHSVGGVHGTVLNTAEIFGNAVITRSKYIILLHNHPSGVAAPSPEDCIAMDKLTAQARVMDMYLLDFIIISDKDYWSMFEKMEGGDYTLGALR